MTTGKKLRLLRDKAGKTQAQVCKDLHIEQSTLANYERDMRTPKPDILRSIAKYYGVSMEYLLDQDAGPDEIQCGEIADRIRQLATIRPISGVKKKLKTSILEGSADQDFFMDDVRILADYFGVSDEYILHGEDESDSALAAGSAGQYPDGSQILLDSYTALSMSGRRKLLAYALQLFQQEHNEAVIPPDPDDIAESSGKTGTDDYRGGKS
jgi:transcriptional regulator with XRE-family HTH domain